MTRRTWLQVGRFVVFGLFTLLGLIFLGWSKVGILFTSAGAAVFATIALDVFFRKKMREAEWQLWIVFILDGILE